MTLPLPNLDTRRWTDLVEEGRAHAIRTSPEWTDHNIHDPGITLLELAAWGIERSIYELNRVPERHLRKFLSLAGSPPRPPTPACVVLEVRSGDWGGVMDLPAGVVLEADARDPNPGPTVSSDDRIPVPFQTRTAATIVDAHLVALHLGDGHGIADHTRELTAGLPVSPFGENPGGVGGPGTTEPPTVYLGFDRPLPIGRTVHLHFFVEGSRASELDAIDRERRAAEKECRRPLPSCRPFPDAMDAWCGHSETTVVPPAARRDGVAEPATRHHSVRLAWEIHSAAGWTPLDTLTPPATDATRALTISGFLRFRVPGSMAALRLGDYPTDRFYIRARLDAGRYDEAPILRRIVLNAVEAVQRAPVWEEFTLAPLTAGSGTLTLGAATPLALEMDGAGRITRLEAGAPDAPLVYSLAHSPATPGRPARLRLGMTRLARGTDLPSQIVDMAPSSLRGRVTGEAGCPPACRGQAVEAPLLWSVQEAGGSSGGAWSVREDLDASGPKDWHVALDHADAVVRFGDGVRGRPLGTDQTLLGRYALTLGEPGNVAPGRSWQLAGHPLNGALLGAVRATVEEGGRKGAIGNPLPASGGSDAETTGDALARAAAAFWAHERLIELAEEHGAESLDQLDRDLVRSFAAPARAATTLDFERLALSVPGARVRRARAWASMDPDLGCLSAPGTVTVVLVPSLPLGRPTPSAGLLRIVESFLNRRRTLGTRLLVRGPAYVSVTVRTTVRPLDTADADETARRVRHRLERHFDPLTGGAAGRGWPFGRHVYAAEVLDVIDRVRGVDHVASLSLAANGVEMACDNICLPTIGLVASGVHDITVEKP